MQLAGKTAVVTGGASGIGKALASELHRHGVRVIVADIDQQRLNAVASELGLIPCVADVRSADSMQALANFTVEQFGGLDILCNNAGVGPVGRIADLTLADWHWIMDINFFGVVHGIRAFMPILEKNPHGAYILNTASTAGYVPAPMLGAYSASKFAVVAMSEALAEELSMNGSKVKVGVLAPAGVHTNITNIGRYERDKVGTGLFAPDLSFLDTISDIKPIWLEADEVARIAVKGIVAERALIVTHDDQIRMVKKRHEAVEAAHVVVR